VNVPSAPTVADATSVKRRFPAPGTLDAQTVTVEPAKAVPVSTGISMTLALSAGVRITGTSLATVEAFTVMLLVAPEDIPEYKVSSFAPSSRSIV